MTAFALSLLRVGAAVLAASGLGWGVTAALLPARVETRLERWGWSFAAGAALLTAFVPLSFAVGVRPGWIPFLILGAACVGAGYGFRVPGSGLEEPSPGLGTRNSQLGTRISIALLWLLIVLGVAIYALQALTEPMWSNDFLAIWGLKGKTIFGSGSVPARLSSSAELGFSHPEYPLGVPFLYAGVAFLTGRWDDHAMALLFPLFQLATLAVAVGWLRRRGVPRTAALLAAAILANFEPLYSAFLTGLAEVPLSFGVLLFGTALGDSLEAAPAQPGALRRLTVSGAVLAATKNEGLFLAAAGCAVGLAFGGRRRWRIAAAALPTALLVHLLHLLWRGRLPLRDFDFGLFSFARLGEGLSAASLVLGLAGWAGAVLVAALVALGRRRPDADALLALAACAGAAYLILPVFAVRGPSWLVQTTLARVSSGLAPLAAAAIALRYASDEPGKA